MGSMYNDRNELLRAQPRAPSPTRRRMRQALAIGSLCALVVSLGCGYKTAAGAAGGAAGAQADQPAQAAANAAPAGRVIAIGGAVTARRSAQGATARTLSLTDDVFGDDQVETAAEASVTIALLHNNARWALGPSQSRRVDASLAWRAPRTSNEAVLARGPVDLGTAAAGRHSEQEAASTTESQQRPSEEARGEGVGLGTVGTVGSGAVAPAPPAPAGLQAAEPPRQKQIARAPSKKKPAKASAPRGGALDDQRPAPPPPSPAARAAEAKGLGGLGAQAQRPGSGTTANGPQGERADRADGNGGTGGNGAADLLDRVARGKAGSKAGSTSLRPPAPSARATVDIRLKALGAGLTTEQERIVLASARSRMRLCGDRLARSNPKASGTLVIRLTFNAQGQVAQSELIRETIGDATCAAARLWCCARSASRPAALASWSRSRRRSA